MRNTLIIYSTLALMLLMSSCKENTDTPKKVIYENRAKEKEKQVAEDTSKIQIADLPIQMDGTKYLIHPIGDFRIYEGRSKSTYGSSNTDNVSFSISNYDRFEITGFLHNIKFQHIDSTTIRSLTDKPILIQTASYLNTISDKTKQQLMVYNIVDMDTNKDNKLDLSDIKSLYISDISGKNFIKISEDFQELIDWNLIESKNRLYFRTIDDTNKNGQFDKNDNLHYYFVDLLSSDKKPQIYNPV